MNEKYEELIKAFHMTWDEFPGQARLINSKSETIAINKFAASLGMEVGQICAKFGALESHKGCLKSAVLKEKIAKIDRPNEEKVRGWLPVEGYDDVAVHFSLAIPNVN